MIIRAEPKRLRVVRQKVNEKEIYENTIYRVVHGSRAYGTHRPDSDRDEKGVCILADPKYYFGTASFEQKDIGWEDNNDRVIFDIRKFFKLALACNPNIVEILYVDDEDILYIDELGMKLRSSRDIFLSRKAAGTFVGYANSQLARIRGHKSWLDSDLVKPKEENFWHEHSLGCSDPPYKKELDNHCFIVEPPTLDTGVVKFRHFDGAGFKAANKQYRQYLDWKKHRNPDRARIEAEHGFDRKHAYHLIRLLRMGKEIITEGVVRVRRQDAAELLDIRHGRKFSYDELVSYADNLAKEVRQAVDISPLPDEPDYLAAESLLVELIRSRLKDGE